MEGFGTEVEVGRQEPKGFKRKAEADGRRKRKRPELEAEGLERFYSGDEKVLR